MKDEVATLSLTVHTARRSYAGPDRLDISRAANHPLGRYFSPSKEILDQANHAGRTEAAWLEYSEAYVNEMRRLYRDNRRPFEAIAAVAPVTIVCLCANHMRCHRWLLAEILVKLGWTYGGEHLVRPVADQVLQRRSEGWVENRTFSWLMRKAGEISCLHCGTVSTAAERSEVETFVARHVGCMHQAAEERRDPPHHCHAKLCETVCAPERLMCPRHWRMVPAELQREVWRTYRPGQCDDKKPSLAWLAAARAAIDAVAVADARQVKYPGAKTEVARA